jgi:hypothetical protein
VVSTDRRRAATYACLFAEYATRGCSELCLACIKGACLREDMGICMSPLVLACTAVVQRCTVSFQSHCFPETYRNP